MWIDKVKDYYTAEDRERLAALTAQYDALIKAGADAMEQRKAEAGKPKPDQALLNRLWAITNDTLLQKMPVVGEQRESIIAAAEQRYIDALKDDPAAVLRDVEEIVAAVTKDEYIADQKRINEILSPLDTIEDKQARKTSQKLKTQGFANCYSFI